MTEREDVWKRRFPGRRERDRLLLALLAYGGLRRSELLGLDWDDVDLERRVIRVRRAKGGRQRVVPIHPALVALFLAYLATRLPLTERALFTGVQGKRLSATIMAMTFRRYATASGVNARKRVTPHTLRHVFASELLSAGANLRQTPGSCWGTSTWTPPSATRASPPTSCAARSSGWPGMTTTARGPRSLAGRACAGRRWRRRGRWRHGAPAEATSALSTCGVPSVTLATLREGGMTKKPQVS